MDSEHLVTGDPEIDTASRYISPQDRQQASHQRWHFSASNGADEEQPRDDLEQRPLLSRDVDQLYSPPDYQPTSSDNLEDTRGQEWHGAKDFEGYPWWKKPSMNWLLGPFFLYTLSFGGIVVPKLNLILSLICRNYMSERSTKDPGFQMMPVIFGQDNPQCQVPEVQAAVARFTLYGNFIAGLLSAITSPKLRAFSDRHGRPRVMAFTVAGSFLSEILNIVAATYPDMFNVNLLLVGYAVEGICGSFTAAMALTNAYAADTTSPSRRAVTFAYIHGVLFGGIALGPLIAAYVIKATGTVLSVFYISLACHTIFFLFLAVIIPESLTKERQLIARSKHEFIGPNQATASRSWLSFLKGNSIFAPLSVLWPTGPDTSTALRRNLALLAAVDTCMFGVAMGGMTVIIIYSGFMFGWGNFESSIFVSSINICRATVLMVLLPLLSRIFRGPRNKIRNREQSGSDNVDLYIIRTAILFDMLGYIGYATVRIGPLFILSGALASIGGMGSPTLSSAMTKHVPHDRVGQMLGAMGLLHALARVISPTVFNAIYSVTVGIFTQTVFVCLAATFGVAFILSWGIRAGVHWDEHEHGVGGGGGGVGGEQGLERESDRAREEGSQDARLLE